MPQVLFSPEAESQVREIHKWWRENRPSAPDLFLIELEKAVEILSHAPDLGRIYRASPIPGVRRLLLPATRYHLYYLSSADKTVVLAVWHGQRGKGPPLRQG